MAHELSIQTIDGRNIVEAMYANRPAWHDLGTIFDPGGNTAPSWDEAIELAHLDWTVEKEPMKLEDGTAVDNFYALVRQDTRKTLSVVGNEYQVLQNREAGEFIGWLLQDGVMRFETAFAMKDGKDVALLARLPSVDYVTPDDPQLRYLLWSMSHGGASITAKITTVRVVCANTLAVALRGKRGSSEIKIRHSGDLDAKLRDAHAYLSQLDAAFTDYTENAAKLASRSVSKDQQHEYVTLLYPALDDDASKRAKTIRDRAVGEVTKALRSPANSLPSIRGTWWQLFNAVTETVDHGTVARESRDPRERAENRYVRTTKGAGESFKELAFETALTMSA